MGSHLGYDDRELSPDLPSVPTIAEAIGMRTSVAWCRAERPASRRG